MTALLTLIEGPAGGGKSAVARRMLQGREIQVLADVTALWAALSGAQRDAAGRYPERADDDPALALARYMQVVTVRQGLRQGLRVGVTSSQRNQAARWRRIAEEVLAEYLIQKWTAEAAPLFGVRTVDPGRAVVEDRLAQDGQLSAACDRAIGRWYGNRSGRARRRR